MAFCFCKGSSKSPEAVKIPEISYGALEIEEEGEITTEITTDSNGLCACGLTRREKRIQNYEIEHAFIGDCENLPVTDLSTAAGIANLIANLEFMFITYFDALTDYIAVYIFYETGFYTLMWGAIAGLLIQIFAEFAGLVETNPEEKSAIMSREDEEKSMNDEAVRDFITPILIVLRLKIAYEGILVITSGKTSRSYLTYKTVDAIFRTYTQNLLQLYVFFETFNSASATESGFLVASIAFALVNLAQTIASNMYPKMPLLSVANMLLIVFFAAEVSFRFLSILVIFITLGVYGGFALLIFDSVVRVRLIENNEFNKYMKNIKFIHHLRPLFLKLLIQSVTDLTPDSVRIMFEDDRNKHIDLLIDLRKKRGIICICYLLT